MMTAFLGLCMAGLLTVPGENSAQGPPPRPNFIVLLCDDLGYGDLGCFGHPTIRTPHLDRLAGQGMKLTHCYAAAPVCTPSRAAMLTGRYPRRGSMVDWLPEGSPRYLSPSQPSVAKLLGQAGYRTGFFGKWHLSGRLDGTQPTPEHHGFADWAATVNTPDPGLEKPTNFVRNGKLLSEPPAHATTFVVDEGLRFLREAQEAKQPFLLFLWFHAPHEPVDAPTPFQQQYSLETDPTRRQYYGCVSHLDHEIGRLLEGLTQRGLAENTLLFFGSDNGPEELYRAVSATRSHGSTGPLRGRKLQLYEGGIRTPGILSWPGRVLPGQVCTTPVSQLDLLPTFCELAGVRLPTDRVWDGVSLAPLLKGTPLHRHQPLYWQYPFTRDGPWQLALRQGRWKLLANGRLDLFALYDLETDPGEVNDLAFSKPDVVRDLALGLRQRTVELYRSGLANHPRWLSRIAIAVSRR